MKKTQYIEWTPIKVEAVEFRLYYNERGEVLYYTTEKLEGEYIVIDNNTFASARYDIKVINGKIIEEQSKSSYSMIIDVDGITCAYEDINIIVDESYEGKTNKWNFKLYEH